MSRYLERYVGKKARRQQSGQVLPVMACVLLAMIAILGLVMDAGMIQANRRHGQRAADAAAQAGARWLLGGQASSNVASAISAARLYAAQNMILSNNVSVEIPPTSSRYFNGSNGYVRVLVTRPVNTTFMRLFLRLPTATVAAYATAGSVPAPIPIAVLALNPTKRAAQMVGGGGILKVVGGSVQVNSSHRQAVSIDGNTTVEATEFNVVGGVDNPESIQGTLSRGAPAEPDPFANTVAPLIYDHNIVLYGDGTTGSTSPSSAGSWDNPRSTTLSGNATLYPGIYYGGIKITGGNITMMPGRYVMAGGGFSVSGSGTGVSGTDVFIYNTYDPYQMTGAGAYGDINLTGGANLLAPTAATDGYYKGLLFFNDRNPSNTSVIKLSGQLEAGNTAPLKGFIYSPNGDVQISGGAGSQGLGIVADTIKVTGGGTLGVIDTSRIPDIRVVRLVE